jgi:hypothetical protein
MKKNICEEDVARLLCFFWFFYGVVTERLRCGTANPVTQVRFLPAPQDKTKPPYRLL